MSRGSGKSGQPPRTIAPDEAELWSRVARTVDKTRKKSRVPSHADEAPSPPAVAPAKPKTPAAKPRQTPPFAKPAPASPPSVPKPPPLADFDRRSVRQVTAGKAPIDARLDLHGMRQADARVELKSFLRACQGRGLKTVLVITGKGGALDDRDYLAGALGKPQRGVLRRAVPQWLEEPEMRTVVLSYTTAGPRHGGEGALYVQLRKARRA